MDFHQILFKNLMYNEIIPYPTKISNNFYNLFTFVISSTHNCRKYFAFATYFLRAHEPKKKLPSLGQFFALLISFYYHKLEYPLRASAYEFNASEYASAYESNASEYASP